MMDKTLFVIATWEMLRIMVIGIWEGGLTLGSVVAKIQLHLQSLVRHFYFRLLVY